MEKSSRPSRSHSHNQTTCEYVICSMTMSFIPSTLRDVCVGFVFFANTCFWTLTQLNWFYRILFFVSIVLSFSFFIFFLITFPMLSYAEIFPIIHTSYFNSSKCVLLYKYVEKCSVGLQIIYESTISMK